VAAKEKALNSQTKALLDLISLYKALGGGWENDQKSS
jgi:outer membrane protein TolC